MFIKHNNNSYNSVSIRRISIENQLMDFENGVSECWIWAYLSDNTKARIGVFADRKEAERVMEEYIYPSLVADECLNLDAVYRQLNVGMPKWR